MSYLSFAFYDCPDQSLVNFSFLPQLWHLEYHSSGVQGIFRAPLYLLVAQADWFPQFFGSLVAYRSRNSHVKLPQFDRYLLYDISP